MNGPRREAVDGQAAPALDRAPAVGHGRAHVEVAREGEVAPGHEEVADRRRARSSCQRALDAGAGLVHLRVLEVRVEELDRTAAAGRRRWGWWRSAPGSVGTWRAGEGDRLHVDGVAGVRGADHDRRRAAVEEAVAGAHHRLRVRASRPGPRRGAKLFLSDVDEAGVDAGGRELRVGVAHVGLRDVLEVVAQAEAEGQVAAWPATRPAGRRAYSLRSGCVSGAGGARAREALLVGLARRVGHAAAEAGQRVEAVAAAEVAGEEVEDAVEVQVEARPSRSGRRGSR